MELTLYEGIATNNKSIPTAVLVAIVEIDLNRIVNRFHVSDYRLPLSTDSIIGGEIRSGT